MRSIGKCVPEFYILEENQRVESRNFLRVMMFFYRAHGRMRCSENYSAVHILPYEKYFFKM